jgi:hypothetical protein
VVSEWGREEMDRVEALDNSRGSSFSGGETGSAGDATEDRELSAGESSGRFRDEDELVFPPMPGAELDMGIEVRAGLKVVVLAGAERGNSIEVWLDVKVWLYNEVDSEPDTEPSPSSE